MLTTYVYYQDKLCIKKCIKKYDEIESINHLFFKNKISKEEHESLIHNTIQCIRDICANACIDTIVNTIAKTIKDNYRTMSSKEARCLKFITEILIQNNSNNSYDQLISVHEKAIENYLQLYHTINIICSISSKITHQKPYLYNTNKPIIQSYIIQQQQKENEYSEYIKSIQNISDMLTESIELSLKIAYIMEISRNIENNIKWSESLHEVVSAAISCMRLRSKVAEEIISKTQCIQSNFSTIRKEVVERLKI